jgi:GNAT superfamily N-acetyltransferase
MVGGARAVTDLAFFAWIADVFVVPPARGCGLGKFLMRCIVDDLADVDRLFLGTRDAHGLYTQVGFVAPPRPERWMERLLDPPRL